MPLTIVKQDITTMHVDVIVNAANSALAPGGGVCGAIFAAAGYAEMARACRKLGGCPTGQAVMTEGLSFHCLSSDFRRYLWLSPEAGVGDCRVFDAGISHRT